MGQVLEKNKLYEEQKLMICFDIKFIKIWLNSNRFKVAQLLCSRIRVRTRLGGLKSRLPLKLARRWSGSFPLAMDLTTQTKLFLVPAGVKIKETQCANERKKNQRSCPLPSGGVLPHFTQSELLGKPWTVIRLPFLSQSALHQRFVSSCTCGNSISFTGFTSFISSFHPVQNRGITSFANRVRRIIFISYYFFLFF